MSFQLWKCTSCFVLFLILAMEVFGKTTFIGSSKKRHSSSSRESTMTKYYGYTFGKNKVTVQRGHTKRPIDSSYYNFHSAGLRTPGKHTFAPALPTNKNHCDIPNQVLYDESDLSMYKICVFMGRSWVIYKYHCPKGSSFEPIQMRCVASEINGDVNQVTTSSTEKSQEHPSNTDEINSSGSEFEAISEETGTKVKQDTSLILDGVTTTTQRNTMQKKPSTSGLFHEQIKNAAVKKDTQSLYDYLLKQSNHQIQKTRVSDKPVDDSTSNLLTTKSPLVTRWKVTPESDNQMQQTPTVYRERFPGKRPTPVRP